jgi:glycosyltransferase involved in cell wall biosynthesis
LRLGIGVYADEPSGLAVATVDTALALHRAGIDVTLFALPESSLPARAAPIADRVVYLAPLPRALRSRAGSTALFLAARMLVSTRLADALQRHPVDAVHVFSPGMAGRLPAGVRASVQAWFHPPRLVPRLRTLLPFTARPVLYPLNVVVQTQSHLADLAGYRRADVVLANTEVAAAAMRDHGFTSACLPPPVDVGEEGAVRRERGGALRLAFCSHPLTLRRKGLRFLLEALPMVRHRPIEVTLVGGMDPSLEPGIERVRQAGIEVRTPGRIARDEYLELLSSEVDLLVFPSLYEEWGYALFEALGRGVPALAFDLYPFSEILDERTGMLAPAGDSAALAAAVDRAATGDLPSAETVRGATRERFGSDHTAQRLLEVLR